MKLFGLTLAIMLACGAGITGCGGSSSDGGSKDSGGSVCIGSQCGDEVVAPDGTTDGLSGKYAEGFTIDVLSDSERVRLGTSDDFLDVSAEGLMYGTIMREQEAVDNSDTSGSLLDEDADSSTSQIRTVFYYVLDAGLRGGNIPSNELIDSIRIQGTDGVWTNKTIYIGTDPLLRGQWHLKNTGQDLYNNTSGGKSGVDYNVLPAWESGARGQGVTVLVVDEDMEIKHEDLAANVDTNSCWNLLTKTHDTTYTPTLNKGHGTSVAGIIGAVGENFLGGRGVAYKSKLAAVNHLSAQTTSTISDVFINYALKNSRINVINNSWVNGDFGQTVLQSELDVLDSLAENNKVVVASVGNYNATVPIGGDSSCKNSGVFYNCSFAQASSISVHPQSIIVGALAADGTIADYSSYSSGIWVSGLGGGIDMYDMTLVGPLILTTDASGCSAGYSNSESTYNKFEHGALAENASCNYTSTYDGTSAAAPGISGIVALILSANASLDPSQVRYILMKSARNDEDLTLSMQPETTITFGGRSTVIDYGWQTNAAGNRFSARYGFGLPDAEKAVELARDCTAIAQSTEGQECYQRTLVNSGSVLFNGGSTICTESKLASGAYKYNCSFPDEADWVGYGSSSAYPVTDSVYLEIRNDFVFDNTRSDIPPYCETASFAYDGTTNAKSQMQFELISPAGTHSVLKPFYQNIGSSSIFNESVLTLRTNAFYGEELASGYKAVIYSKCPLKLPKSGGASGFMRVVAHGFKQ